MFAHKQKQRANLISDNKNDATPSFQKFFPSSQVLLYFALAIRIFGSFFLMASVSKPRRIVHEEVNPDDISNESIDVLVRLLQEWGVLPTSIACPQCKSDMTLIADVSSIDKNVWYCGAHNNEEEQKAIRQKKKKRPSSEYRCNKK